MATILEKVSTNYLKLYAYPVALSGLLLCLSISVVYFNPGNPSNYAFIFGTFLCMSLVGTGSALIAKEGWSGLSSAMYVVFILFFNLMLVVLSVIYLIHAKIENTWISSTGFDSNIEVVLMVGLVMELILDWFAYHIIKDVSGDTPEPTPWSSIAGPLVEWPSGKNVTMVLILWIESGVAIFALNSDSISADISILAIFLGISHLAASAID